MLITTTKAFEELLPRIEQSEYVVADVETTGLDVWRKDKICGVGLCFPDGSTVYLPYRHSHPESKGSNLPKSTMRKLWKAMNKTKLVGYNFKFDLAAMHSDGFEVARDQELEDLIVAARMTEADRFPDLTLRGQTSRLLGAKEAEYDIQFKKYLQKHGWSKHFDQAPAEIVGEYCEGDVERTWRLRKILLQLLTETEQIAIWQQECKVTYVLWRMEARGMFFDREYGEAKIPQLDQRVEELKQEIYEGAGKEFNVNSPKQLSAIMTNLGLTSPRKSAKTQQESWGVGELMSVSHPIAGKIVEMRGLEKLCGTYFKPIVSWGEVIHAFFKNWGTITGRMSCTNPNLQNIAKNVTNLEGNDTSDEALAALQAFMGARKGEATTDMTTASGGLAGGITLGGMMSLTSSFEDDVAVSVRRLFVPRPGYRLYMADYSQMEMRVFADYVGDAELFRLLEDPKFDFHSHVAKSVWHVEESSELWDFYRTLAKAVNFGLIYGIGVKKLAAQIQKSVDEAKAYKVEYFERFPKALTFMDIVSKTAVARHYVRNRFFRRYWIDEQRAYVAVNYLVQGTSADIVKNRMVAIQQAFEARNLKSYMLAQVHDELVFEVPEAEWETTPGLVKSIMEERLIKTFLPVELSMGVPSWAQKEKLAECGDGHWYIKKLEEEHKQTCGVAA